MADPKGRLFRTGDMDIPIPNKALGEWLVSPQCKAAVTEIAQHVWREYVNALPESRVDFNVPGSGLQNLKKGAKIAVGIIDSGGGPRYHAWVVNRALSYRNQKWQPYPRFIEYGKPSKGIKGGRQLRNAAEAVARAGLARQSASVAGGLINPPQGQARPARRVESMDQRRQRELIERARIQDAKNLKQRDELRRAREENPTD
jgi:hypothetical protein